MEVRPAAPHDLADIRSVLLRAYEAAWGTSGWEEYRRELAHVASRASETLVATVDGVVAGAVVVLEPSSPMRSIEHESSIEIRMLGVDPRMQRRGVATALLRACRSKAASHGLAALVLQCDDDLMAAHLLYRSFGFSRRESLDVDVADGHQALGYALSL